MWPQEMSDVESGADRCIGKPGIPQLLAVKKDYIHNRPSVLHCCLVHVPGFVCFYNIYFIKAAQREGSVFMAN